MFSLFYKNISKFKINFDRMNNFGNYKNKIKRMYLYGWNNHYFKSAGVYTMGNGFGLSQFTHFYDKSIKT